MNILYRLLPTCCSLMSDLRNYYSVAFYALLYMCLKRLNNVAIKKLCWLASLRAIPINKPRGWFTSSMVHCRKGSSSEMSIVCRQKHLSYYTARCLRSFPFGKTVQNTARKINNRIIKLSYESWPKCSLVLIKSALPTMTYGLLSFFYFLWVLWMVIITLAYAFDRQFTDGTTV